MPRRKQIVTKQGDELYRTVIIGGPKKVLNRRRVRRQFAKKQTYGYEPVRAKWFQKLIAEVVSTRQRRHLSQQALASILGTNQAEISDFETGKSNPTVEFLSRLCQTLEIKIEIKTRK